MGPLPIKEGIGAIHWLNCSIKTAVEIPERNQLIWNVQYPEDPASEVYVPKRIVFDGYFSQEVDEYPCEGEPCLRIAAVLGEVGPPCKLPGYYKIMIKTTAGTRYVVARNVKLVDGHMRIQGV